MGWYRNTIRIPESDLGKHIALRFDGIFRNARVWFNGCYMGSVTSGYDTPVKDEAGYEIYECANHNCGRT